MVKPLDMNSKKIIELADPTDDADAVNKRYADQYKTHFSLASTGLFLNKSIMMNTNKLTALEQPEDDDDAATKLYVDSRVRPLNIVIPTSRIPNRQRCMVTTVPITLGITVTNISQVLPVLNYNPFVKQVNKTVLDQRSITLTVTLDNITGTEETINITGILLVLQEAPSVNEISTIV
jgi:hypothetical protein